MKRFNDLVYTLEVRIRADLVDDLREFQEALDIIRAVGSVQIVDTKIQARDAEDWEID